jgi:hypothetical protein
MLSAERMLWGAVMPSETLEQSVEVFCVVTDTIVQSLSSALEPLLSISERTSSADDAQGYGSTLQIVLDIYEGLGAKLDQLVELCQPVSMW